MPATRRLAPAAARQPMTERTANVLLIQVLTQLGAHDVVEHWFSRQAVLDEILVTRELYGSDQRPRRTEIRAKPGPEAAKTRARARNARS